MSWRLASGIISIPVQLGFQHWGQLCGRLEATALLILPETPGLGSLTGSGLTTPDYAYPHYTIPHEYTQSYKHVPTDYPSKRSSKLAKLRLWNHGEGSAGPGTLRAKCPQVETLSRSLWAYCWLWMQVHEILRMRDWYSADMGIQPSSAPCGCNFGIHCSEFYTEGCGLASVARFLCPWHSLFQKNPCLWWTATFAASAPETSVTELLREAFYGLQHCRPMPVLDRPVQLLKQLIRSLPPRSHPRLLR